MSASSRRAARRELEAARVLGGERVRFRPRFASAPDVLPLRLADGTTIQLEVKSRANGLKLVLGAIAQANGYSPDAIAVAVLSVKGESPIAALRLADLARLVGIREPAAGEQLALLARAPTP